MATNNGGARTVLKNGSSVRTDGREPVAPSISYGASTNGSAVRVAASSWARYCGMSGLLGARKASLPCQSRASSSFVYHPSSLTNCRN